MLKLENLKQSQLHNLLGPGQNDETMWSPSQNQGKLCPFPQVYCPNPPWMGHPKGTGASVLGCAQYPDPGCPSLRSLPAQGEDSYCTGHKSMELAMPSAFTFTSLKRPVSSTSKVNLNSFLLCPASPHHLSLL